MALRHDSRLIADIPGHTTSTVIGLSETSAAGSRAREDVCGRPAGLPRDGAATSVCERSDLRRQGVQECVGMEDVNEVPTVEEHDVLSLIHISEPTRLL